jgi:hypothetical protein
MSVHTKQVNRDQERVSKAVRWQQHVNINKLHIVLLAVTYGGK